MNSVRISFTIKNDKLESNTIKSDAGAGYRIVLNRELDLGNIVNDLGTPIATIVGDTNRRNILQAVREYMVANLNVRFAVDQADRDNGNVTVTAI